MSAVAVDRGRRAGRGARPGLPADDVDAEAEFGVGAHVDAVEEGAVHLVDEAKGRGDRGCFRQMSSAYQIWAALAGRWLGRLWCDSYAARAGRDIAGEALEATMSDMTKLLVDDEGIHEAIEAGSSWLRGLLGSTGQRRFVVGLSGGIDSAVVAMWAARAVGGERLTLLALPYGLLEPSIGPASAADSLEDARRVFEAIPGADARELDIAAAVDREARTLGLLDEDTVDEALGDELRRRAFGNLKARIRAVRLRTVANLERGLLLGTENLSESWLGYFTLGGDEQSDAELITHLLKTEVRAFARALGVPASIREKPPSADLWAGQTDEAELGVSYDDVDKVIAARVRGARLEASAEVRARVERQIEATQYKRDPKPSFDPHTR